MRFPQIAHFLDFRAHYALHSIRSTERTHFPQVKEQSAQSSDFLYLATNRLSQQHLDNLPWVYTTNLKHCKSTITNTYTTMTSQQFWFKSIPQETKLFFYKILNIERIELSRLAITVFFDRLGLKLSLHFYVAVSFLFLLCVY